MKRMLLASFCPLGCAARGGGRSAGVDEATVLPGTPTGFTITVTNTGKQTVKLPAYLWLVATNDEFETSLVNMYDTSGTAAGAAILPEAECTVPAGGTREFRYDPSVVLVGSPWFTDGRLSRPGTYRLRAVFAPEVALDGTYNAAHGIASKEEELMVATGSDEDAAV
jgi:hypothetical protein